MIVPLGGTRATGCEALNIDIALQAIKTAESVGVNFQINSVTGQTPMKATQQRRQEQIFKQ